MPVPLVPVAIGVGKVALPTLAKEFAKRGGTAFIKKYGRQTFNALVGGTAGYEASKFIPTIHGGEELPKIEQESFPAEDKIKTWDESFKAPEKIQTTEGLEIPPQEKIIPPGFSKPSIVDTSILTKDDVSKQTKKLVPEKVELGPLTKVEKETALALKGDKPDYYSRIIKAIEETKQTKMSYDQWAAIAKKAGSKEELDYLDIKGKETISKEDLLSEIGFKDIASNIMVTTIPEEDMVSDFDELSLGFENPGSKKMNVYQIDLLPETSEDAEFNLGKKIFQASPAHVKEKYGRNQFLHTRTQVGLGDPDAPPADFEARNEDFSDQTSIWDSKTGKENAKNISEKLQNTLIIDEIQSDWIQSIQKYGTKDKPKAKVLKGSEITPQFIKENFGDFYDLKIEKFKTQKDLLENTGLSTNKVLYSTDMATGMRAVVKRIDENLYYVFTDKGLTPESQSVAFGEKETAMDHAKDFAVADFPIKHSKKWVAFALNNEIKNAVLNGQDSIAITNGNIQQSRSKQEGTKKFYDQIVRGQLEKIATKYGVKLEEISFEPNKYLRLQENLKKLEEREFEETTVTREELYKYISDNTMDSGSIVNLPDFREIILDNNVARNEDFDAFVAALPKGTELMLFKNKKTGEINFEYPVVAKKFMLKTDKTLKRFLEGFQQWAESRGGALIKMKLPKKLQKEILKEPIKFSKAKQQTERLFT